MSRARQPLTPRKSTNARTNATDAAACRSPTPFPMAPLQSPKTRRFVNHVYTHHTQPSPVPTFRRAISTPLPQLYAQQTMANNDMQPITYRVGGMHAKVRKM